MQTEALQPDLGQARTHIEWLHWQANKLEHDRRRQLALVCNRGQDWEANTFVVGDTIGMANHAVHRARNGWNVYTHAATVSAGITRTATENDVSTVLALVIDQDAQDSGPTVFSDDIAPALSVETSPGSAHHWIALSEASEIDKLKAVGRALRAATSTDATGRPSQLYRVAGTINYPSDKKRAMGRENASVKLCGRPTEQSFSVEQIEAAYGQAFFESDAHGHGSDFAERENRSVEELEALIRADVGLLKTVEDDGEPDRSAHFHRTVGDLRAAGLSSTEVVDILTAFPYGAGAKYLARGDLEKQVKTTWNRVDDRPIDPETEFAGFHSESADTQRADIFETGFYSASSLAGRQVPEREWLVQDLIPMKTVTLLSGDGGTGKSLVALQLAAATAGNADWLEKQVRHGPAIYVSAEDDDAELHRRLAALSDGLGFELETLTALWVRSVAGEAALLATEKGSRLRPSKLHAALDQQAAEVEPALIVLDTLADFYPSNENDRAKVVQFINLLRGLAIRHHAAVLLLSHPSLTGMSTGSGISGSTGWNNSVRSRIYLERIKTGDYEPDPDRRRLTTKKINYGRVGEEIHVKWIEGRFDVIDLPTVTEAQDLEAERLFLELLTEHLRQGRNVSPNPSNNFAPTVFAAHSGADGMTKDVFKAAMNRLLERCEIEVFSYGKSQSSGIRPT